MFGLNLAAYEAHPGMKVGDTANIGNRIIEAQRNPEVKHDILKNWLAHRN